MTRTRIVVLSASVAFAAAAFALWWFMFRDTAPEQATLAGAVAAVNSSTEPGAAPIDPGEVVEGDWLVVADGSSFVGYRVQEELASIGAKTAVGRTPAVEGGFTVSAGTVTAMEITADLTGLESDDSRRDGALRRQALEIDRFPTARFLLTGPIDLPAGAGAGEAVTVVALGELTLHGVTRPVQVPLEAQFVEGRIVVVGSLPILFADYEIERPRSAIVLSVDDNGIMEMQLVFAPAG